MDRRGLFAGRIQELAALWEAIPSFARALMLPVVIIAATVAVLFVPCPEHLTALSDAESATAFLSVAWPVTGVRSRSRSLCWYSPTRRSLPCVSQSAFAIWP
jgi:hypothetical protein